jgi:hypothetical protein
VSWSDKCTVERGVGAKPIWTFTRPRDQILLGDVQPIRCSGKGLKKTPQAASRRNQRSGSAPLNGDPNSRRGGVTSFVIRDLYRAFLPNIIVEGGEFMHNGASIHTSHIIRDLLGEMQIRVIEWPTYSPNLNPIENGARPQRQHPDGTGYHPQRQHLDGTGCHPQRQHPNGTGYHPQRQNSDGARRNYPYMARRQYKPQRHTNWASYSPQCQNSDGATHNYQCQNPDV